MRERKGAPRESAEPGRHRKAEPPDGAESRRRRKEPDEHDGPRGDDLLHDLAETARYLGSLSKVGVPWPPPGPAGEVSSAAAVAAVAGRAGGPASDAGTDSVPALAASSAAAAPAGIAGTGEAGLRAIREEMGDCTRCRLSEGRKTIVFGQGNPNAELMFVGEAPGAEEDQQGLAFVGRAGQLLTDIIEKGLKMKRSDVYITNVQKCRPPQNRNPEPDEIVACQPFLEAQIRAIRPRVIVGLGKFGAHWLLKTAVPITRLRGKLGEYEGIPVMPTYHPAYLLRNPSAKKDLWEDMKMVLQILGRPVPK
jgi:uracil-DNA glycosylase family 4